MVLKNCYWRWLTRLSLGLALGWGLGSAVYAHATLISTDPPDRGVVVDPPAQVRLIFNEPVQVTQLQLRSSGGAVIPLLPGSERQAEQTFSLDPLPADLYVVSWRAISLDSHPVSGSWVFRVGEGDLPVLAAEENRDPLAWAVLAVRWGLYVSTLLVVGLGIPKPLGGRGVRDAWVWGAVWVSFSLTVVALALHLAQLYPRVDLAALSHVAGSPFGWGILSRFVGAGLVIAGYPLGAGVMLLSLLPAGHALTAGTGTLILLGLHLSGIAFWLAGLIQIERGWLDPEGILWFSRRATWVVPGLVAAGMAMGWIHRGWEQGWEHPYGLWLSGKVGITLMLLGLAAHNKFRLLPALLGGAPVSTSLRRSVRLELVGIGIIFVLSTLLVSQAPPPPPSGCQATFTGSAVNLRLEVRPCQAGTNTITITPEQGILELSLAFVQGDMPPLRRTLPPDPDGQFRLTGTELAFPGVWQIQIAALVNDFVQERGSVEIQVSERGYSHAH